MYLCFFCFCTACSSEGELGVSPKPGTDEWNKLLHEEKITAYGQLSEQDPNGLYATSSFAVGDYLC